MAEREGSVGPDRISDRIGEPVVAVADDEIVFANRRFLEITASGRRAVVGADASWFHQFVDEGLDTLRAALDAVALGDSPEERVEVTMLHPEESSSPRRLPVEARVTPLGDDGGGVVVALRNIAALKEREQELRALTDEYEALFENTDDGIFLVDVEHTGSSYEFRFQRLNPAHEEISGMTTEETQGKTPREALGEDAGARVYENYRRCVEAGETISFEETLPMPRGDIVWETKLTPVVVDGEVTRIVGVARDVTERVRQERRLERQKQRLEEFASVLSHDLRNPLNVAQGHLDLVREEHEGDRLDEIADAHARMEELVDDLLALARAGEAVSDVEDVALGELIEGCWQTVETTGASLSVETAAEVRADRSRLRQLVENLFRNAVEHGGEGVTVSVGDREDGFFVEDDGVGIPEADREAVFERGYTTAASGSGFGLAIVREIAEAHGWDVRATERTEGGARFEITGVEFAG